MMSLDEPLMKPKSKWREIKFIYLWELCGENPFLVGIPSLSSIVPLNLDLRKSPSYMAICLFLFYDLPFMKF